MIIIDMGQFRSGRSERAAQDAVRRILFPGFRCEQDHEYAICLVAKHTGSGIELSQFEAPCVEADQVANIRATVAALREAAIELESAYADILEKPAPTAVEASMPAHVR